MTDLCSGIRDHGRARCVVLAVLACLVAGAAAAQTMVTTTTRYTYNDDGALTSVATQVGAGATETTYLTYDNFVPDVDDPSTGAVSTGNGRLAGYGPVPGSASREAEFAFDRRDRLVGYDGGSNDITYDHHPTGLMASAQAADAAAGGWRFYYGDAPDSQVANLYEPGSQLWSSRLAAGRFVSDGSEQILLTPRKDLVCEYDPRSETVSPLRYDAWGAQADLPPTDRYDIGENPFQYAGEYRDPLWGGIYLRARWYHPDFPTFLSRDPMPAQLNHYGYGGGNPVMNTDPSGKSFGKMLNKLNKGVGGHFARVLLSPFLGPLELAAHPSSFWRQVKSDKDGIDIFLAAGVALELAGPVADFVAPVWVNSLSLRTRFTVRLITDAVIGFGQSSTQAGLLHGVKHFDWHTFAQGSEYTFGGIAWTRLTAGIGYRPFGLKTAKFTDFVRAQDLQNGEALVFREIKPGGSSSNVARSSTGAARFSIKAGSPSLAGGLSWTSPWQEAVHLNLIHERLIVVTQDSHVYYSEFHGGFVSGYQGDLKAFVSRARAQDSRFEFVGRKANFNAGQFANMNPREFLTPTQATEYKKALAENRQYNRTFRKYNRYTNNCQHHVSAVIDQLGVR